MAQRMQQRRGTAAQWTSGNPILLSGEFGIETDTKLYKIGDGVTAWNSLSYVTLTGLQGVQTLEAGATEPSTAPTNFMRFYAKQIAGKKIPKYKDDFGLATPVQAAFWSNNITMWSPGATTLPTVIGGGAMTAVGTVSHPTPNTTNSVTQMRRWIITSAATANAIGEIRTAAHNLVWRGNSAGLGGFFHRTSFTIESVTALQRGFIGFTNSSGATTTTQDPAALLSCVGIGFGSSDLNLCIMYANTVTPMKIDLGPDFAVNPAHIYELTLFCPPNAEFINYQVVNLVNGARATGTLTTNLPTNANMLSYHAWINNGGTAAACVLGFRNIYLETDI